MMVLTAIALAASMVMFSQISKISSAADDTSVCNVADTIVIYDSEVHYMTSPNFPSIYPNNLNCWQLIISLGGGGIKVTVWYAALATDGDILVINDAVPIRMLGAIGDTVGAPITYKSSGPMAFIQFVTNYDNGDAGFILTYQVYLQSAGTSDPQSTPTADTASVCDEVLPTILSPGEVYYLTSPNFPSNYSSHLDCWRIILAPSDAFIKVTVWNASLENSDFLQIFDGPPTELVPPAMITGTLGAPITYNSSGRFMFIEFLTFGESGTFGFNLTYEVYLKSAASSASTTTSTTATTSVLTTASTTVATSDQTFPSSTTMTTTSSVLTPASTTVATSVTTTEAATTSTIQFTQKLSSATITTSSSVCNVTNTTTLSAGEVRYLTSPNYPSDYDNNLDCWRLVIAPNGAVIKVTVLYADMEPRYDYLNIYDGMSNSSNLLAGISGTLASPASYNSSGHYLLLHFYTDYNKVNSGFNLTYEVSLPQSASTSGTITTTPSGYNSATGILTDHIILCVIASLFVAMMIQTGHNGSVL